MAIAIRIGAVILVAFSIVAFFFPESWRPWLSPEQAVAALLRDEGKSPLNSGRSASLYWGDAIYSPIEQATRAFDDLDALVPAITLFEVLSSDEDVPSGLASDLTESEGRYSVLIGCYLKLRSADDTANLDYCKQYIADFVVEEEESKGTQFAQRIQDELQELN